MVAGQSVVVQPLTCPWPFQSPTTKPPKFMRPFSASVRYGLLPCIFSPLTLLKEAITVCAPAAMAGG
ncbi:hypothetical protein D3C71_1311630 [compost metagenome]